jgi:uncharacterized membrane protein YdjX (TVP38/TMEM64 family)
MSSKISQHYGATSINSDPQHTSNSPNGMSSSQFADNNLYHTTQQYAQHDNSDETNISNNSTTLSLTWRQILMKQITICNVAILTILLTILTILIIVAIYTLPILLKQYMHWLEKQQPTLKTAIFFFCIMIIACSPIIPGYGILLLGCGYLFGFKGMLIVWPASVLGACLWFILVRTAHRSTKVQQFMIQFYQQCCCSCCFCCFNSNYNQLNDDSQQQQQQSESNSTTNQCCSALRQYMSSNGLTSQLVLIRIAIEKSRWRISTLLQLTPTPFNLLNAGLATQTNISFWNFAFSCCLSRLKLITYIWAAVSSRSLSDALTSKHPSHSAKWHEILILVLSILAAIASAIVIAIYAKRHIAQVEAELLLARQQDQDADADAELSTVQIDESQTQSQHSNDAYHPSYNQELNSSASTSAAAHSSATNTTISNNSLQYALLKNQSKHNESNQSVLDSQSQSPTIKRKTSPESHHHQHIENQSQLTQDALHKSQNKR